MSESQDVDERVEGIIADRFRVDREAFDDDSRLDGDALAADSLDVVEVAEAVDANLGVHIPDEDLEAMETVGDVKAYVRNEA